MHSGGMAFGTQQRFLDHSGASSTLSWEIAFGVYQDFSSSTQAHLFNMPLALISVLSIIQAHLQLYPGRLPLAFIRILLAHHRLIL
jgi:hypothetical protein